MWSTVSLVLLVVVAGASAYTVKVTVPAEPEYGSTVTLLCDYQLDSGESIGRLTWTKDGQELLVYQQRPETFTWSDVTGLNVDRNGSSERAIILTDVQDGASGSYGVSMTISTRQGGSTSTNTYVHNQEMLVGGAVSETLGNRFGGTSNRRPVGSGGGGSVSTFISSSSSSGSPGAIPALPAIPAIPAVPSLGVPAAGAPPVDTLGSRFGGSRPQAAAAPAAGAPSVAAGLQQAQNQLNQAVNQLQEALNQAVNG